MKLGDLPLSSHHFRLRQRDDAVHMAARRDSSTSPARALPTAAKTRWLYLEHLPRGRPPRSSTCHRGRQWLDLDRDPCSARPSSVTFYIISEALGAGRRRPMEGGATPRCPGATSRPSATFLRHEHPAGSVATSSGGSRPRTSRPLAVSLRTPFWPRDMGRAWRQPGRATTAGGDHLHRQPPLKRQHLPGRDRRADRPPAAGLWTSTVWAGTAPSCPAPSHRKVRPEERHQHHGLGAGRSLVWLDGGEANVSTSRPTRFLSRPTWSPPCSRQRRSPIPGTSSAWANRHSRRRARRRSVVRRSLPGHAGAPGGGAGRTSSAFNVEQEAPRFDRAADELGRACPRAGRPPQAARCWRCATRTFWPTPAPACARPRRQSTSRSPPSRVDAIVAAILVLEELKRQEKARGFYELVRGDGSSCVWYCGPAARHRQPERFRSCLIQKNACIDAQSREPEPRNANQVSSASLPGAASRRQLVARGPRSRRAQLIGVAEPRLGRGVIQPSSKVTSETRPDRCRRAGRGEELEEL